MPHLQGRGRGDLIVTVVVDTPAELTKEQDELLRQLAELRGEEVAPPEGGLHVEAARRVQVGAAHGRGGEGCAGSAAGLGREPARPVSRPEWGCGGAALWCGGAGLWCAGAGLWCAGAGLWCAGAGLPPPLDFGIFYIL